MITIQVNLQHDEDTQGDPREVNVEVILEGGGGGKIQTVTAQAAKAASEAFTGYSN